MLPLVGNRSMPRLIRPAAHGNSAKSALLRYQLQDHLNRGESLVEAIQSPRTVGDGGRGGRWSSGNPDHLLARLDRSSDGLGPRPSQRQFRVAHRRVPPGNRSRDGADGTPPQETVVRDAEWKPRWTFGLTKKVDHAIDEPPCGLSSLTIGQTVLNNSSLPLNTALSSGARLQRSAGFRG